MNIKIKILLYILAAIITIVCCFFAIKYRIHAEESFKEWSRNGDHYLIDKMFIYYECISCFYAYAAIFILHPFICVNKKLNKILLIIIMVFTILTILMLIMLFNFYSLLTGSVIFRYITSIVLGCMMGTILILGLYIVEYVYTIWMKLKKVKS